MSTQARLNYLKKNSSFKTLLNWDDYFDFYQKKDLSIKQSDGVSLINGFLGCENCHVGFQIDTYIEGCSHNCLYCYAKIEGEAQNKWNNPLPLPLDLTLIWNEFYSYFEKGNKDIKYAKFFEQKIPLRLGSLSDSFIPMEKKYLVTKELLRILEHYDYPYIIITRSTLISNKEYLDIMSTTNASIHISIPSLNTELTKKLEPGAPTPQERLQCIKALRSNGFWVTARINPLFPIFPDNTYSSGKTEAESEFNFFTFDLVDEIIKTDCKSILAGFVTLKEKPLQELSKLFEFDLKSLCEDKTKQGFFFSEREVRAYFLKIHNICTKNDVDFSSCYLGQDSSQYFSNQDLWSNKVDCCNSVGKVKNHKTTSTNISKHDLILIAQDARGLKKITLKLLSYLLKKIQS